MLAAGKRDDFSRDDLIKVGNDFSLPHPESVIDEVVSTVDNWLSYAGKAGVAENTAQEIREAHRLHLG